MTKAAVLHKPGPPENFSWEDVEVGDPGPGEARVRHSAVGLNFVDTHFRSGDYPPGPLPAILGREGAGVVEAVGDGVTEVAVGQRVGYAPEMGAYAEARVMPVARLVPLPDGISFETAAAIMLKGLTAWYLVRRVRAVGPGDTVLYHAAAGGVGVIACQWAKHLGATVIGTVGSAAKAEVARAHGCDHVINYEQEDFAARVEEIAGSEAMDAVYDAVGAKTFTKSLRLLAPLGVIALYGEASGPVPRDAFADVPRNCILSRPSLLGQTATRQELLTAAGELFEVVESGAVRVLIGGTYPLKDVAAAHHAIAGRKTTGSIVLLP